MERLEMINYVETEHKVVAFTFDDGPDPVYTPQLLDILKEAGAKATFFMIGEQIEKSPEVAARVHAEGHEIGNHTYTHPFLTKLSSEAVLDEFRKTESLIQGITDYKPTTYRPPYFDINDEVLKQTAEIGYIGCAGAANMAAQDWANPGVKQIVEKTRESVRNGAVFIFHDGYGDRSQAVESVRILVKELTEQGYRIVPFRELLTLASK
ncbi:polysaccharide deacetylase family protein [Paenibacillus xylaniclasticus]|uniref:polysaccharide deacetylase family protein n=1 Tax=Paenibacillus xylaniclasticus TaxID=588083 RepID=UPI000FDBF797|nr:MULTISPECIES: polysaccharide deacetylase family protein [Paenibacillus]GFN33891.1 polysaccharide deacetylase family sporulation protein PdaB [Paenibacillus curdlanolyticus]